MGKRKEPFGRPTIYSKEIGDKICELLIQGKSLNKITQLEEMPCKATVHSWLNCPKSEELKDFLDNYTTAREIQAHGFVDEVVDIADEALNFSDPAEIQARRLMADTRKWVACKVLPKIYGDKIQQEVTGKDGADLIPTITLNIGKPPSS